MNLGENTENKMDENIAYGEYLEGQEKSSNLVSKIQSKYVIWLFVVAIIGYTIITFGLGGDKKSYYIAFTGFLILVFIILTQTGDSKPSPRSLREAIEIAEGEGRTLVEKNYFSKEDFNPGKLVVTGKSSIYPEENPNHWRIGVAIIDKESKLPFYYLFKVAYYKGLVGITGIAHLAKPYNGEEPEIRFVPISFEKLQAFKKSEAGENLGR